MDLMYLGITAAMFIATFVLQKICESLSHDKYGEPL